MRSKFELTFISITVLIISIFFFVILSMFFIPSFDGFIEALFSPRMLFAIKLTLYTSLISATVVMLCCIPIAYTLNRYTFPLKRLFQIIIDLPMGLPETVIGIALLMFLGTQGIGIGEYLRSMGIEIVFTSTGIIIAQMFIALPFAVRTLYATFNFIDPRYEFVSRSLGYSELSTFINVTLPMSTHGLFATAIITLARCIGTFGAVLFVGGGIMGRTDTLAIVMYNSLSNANMNMAITAGILLVIISFITIAVMERYAKERHI